MKFLHYSLISEKGDFMAKKKININIAAVKEAVEAAVAEAAESDEVSRVSYDKLGKPLIEGIAAAIRENGFMATDAMKTVMEELNLQLRLGALSTEEYYRYMEAYRDNFFDKGTSGWWEYTLKIMEYEKSIPVSIGEGFKTTEAIINAEKERIIAAYREIASRGEVALAELERSASAMEKKLNSLYEPYKSQKFTLPGDDLIFDNGAWIRQSDKVYTKNTLTDLGAVTEKMEAYAVALEEIKGMSGVPADFFRYLRDLSFEDGMNLSTLLLNADEAGVESYIREWERLKATSKSVTGTLFAEDIQLLKESYGSLGEDLAGELERAFGDIPMTFFENGKLSAQEFGKGFCDKLTGIMEDINDFITRFTTEIELSPSSVTRNASYNFFGSGQTVAEQLAEARVSEALEEMRGL